MHYINKAVTQGMSIVDESRKLAVQYEDFCPDPRQVFGQLVEELNIRDRNNSGPELFKVTRTDDLPNRLECEKALVEFEVQ